jgi:hypothetical protein
MPRNGKLSARERVLEWGCSVPYFPELRYWESKRHEQHYYHNELETPEVNDVFDFNIFNTPRFTVKKELKPNAKIYCDHCCSYVKFKSASNHLNTNRCKNRRFRNAY